MERKLTLPTTWNMLDLGSSSAPSVKRQFKEKRKAGSVTWKPFTTQEPFSMSVNIVGRS